MAPGIVIILFAYFFNHIFKFFIVYRELCWNVYKQNDLNFDRNYGSIAELCSKQVLESSSPTAFLYHCYSLFTNLSTCQICNDSNP